jgi:hypothetical protein
VFFLSGTMHTLFCMNALQYLLLQRYFWRARLIVAIVAFSLFLIYHVHTTKYWNCEKFSCFRRSPCLYDSRFWRHLHWFVFIMMFSHICFCEVNYGVSYCFIWSRFLGRKYQVVYIMVKHQFGWSVMCLKCSSPLLVVLVLIGKDM